MITYKARKKNTKSPMLPHGALSQLSGEYIRLKVDKNSTFTSSDITAYIKDRQDIKGANGQLNTNVGNYLKKQESSGLIIESGRSNNTGGAILWKKC
ncbi:hypothetical protein BHECKSOX_674 [Bathymodiolus heckerae thiotrophic gill symbiont]|uniref:hypothetical protein n=1 Tax=Bathymodiolus heckerae thiotrophic gill symbiont TaxID=1052212 RepID=UPI0010BB8D00|nr:hypothetical protein [Bathymodiolus heckerae thiotrophic gill symbiont]SHN90494.1 hypothetical protein BHECKSOX_674 [Bathymodiolus heckerae thiotrophic gill symbiont]